MTRHSFNMFIRAVNAVRIALGTHPLYWDAPEDVPPDRVLPPEAHIDAVRFGIKRKWDAVLEEWRVNDAVKAHQFTPSSDCERITHRHWLYFRDAQESTKTLIPCTIDLLNGIDQKVFTDRTGLTLTGLRATEFPTRVQIDIAFHQCLIGTGWNLSTLFALDAESPDTLRTHPKAAQQYVLGDATYELCGKKARARNATQHVFGLWKTTSGPGYIVREVLARTGPLRAELKARLTQALQDYDAIPNEAANYEEKKHQFLVVQSLQAGIHAVWLYVDRTGEINWLRQKNMGAYSSEEGQVQLVKAVIVEINAVRAGRGKEEISADVTASDFRDMFALYVMQRTGGDLFTLMKALGHKFIATTECYVDNNILNAKRDAEATAVLDNIFGQLQAGRLDLTTLAHMARFGEVTADMDQRLAEYRMLMRSVHGVACKDPLHPPSTIQGPPQPGKRCQSQRCFLDCEHAIFLPESLDGVARRAEELRDLQSVLPLDTWMTGKFDVEQRNCERSLSTLYERSKVADARSRWCAEISSGRHLVPGLSKSGGLET